MEESYKIGFALSGGFVKGFAHLGAMQALFENGIRPGIISGVSIGSVAAVFIADGKEPHEVLELFMGKDFGSFTSFTRSPGGFMHLHHFYDFLRDNISVKNIEELKIPVIITATNLDRALGVNFRKGDIATHISASCCVPGLFAPIKIDGEYYVDGGVLMNLPVSVIRGKCDKVVAVNLSRSVSHQQYKMSVVGVLYRAYGLMANCNIVHDRRMADLLIEPAGLDGYSNRELDKGREIFDRGYQAALKVIDQVREIIFPA